MNDTTTPLWLQVPEPSELVRRFGSAVDIPAFGGRLEVNRARVISTARQRASRN